MAKISSYDNASPVSLTDKIIGTSVGAVPANATKNFLLSDIQSLFNLTTNTLSDVLAAGNTATNNIVLTGNITGLGTVSAVRVNASNNVEAPTLNADTIAPKGATNQLSVSGILSFANNAAAKQPTGPLVAGNLYITDGTGAAPLNVAGILMVVV